MHIMNKDNVTSYQDYTEEQEPVFEDVRPRVEVRYFFESEIQELHTGIIVYITLLNKAFDKANTLFHDLEKKYAEHFSNTPKDQILVREHEFITEIPYMEEALTMYFLTIGSVVIEVGSTIQNALQVEDSDIVSIDPHKLGEAFLTELFVVARNSLAIDATEKEFNDNRLNQLKELLSFEPKLKNAMRLVESQKNQQNFPEHTWWLMRQVRNDIGHLKQHAKLFALWAVGKHYFPELHSINLALIDDDSKKGEDWEEADEDSDEMGGKGIIFNYLHDQLPKTITALKQAALDRKKLGELKRRGKGTKDVLRGK